MANFKDLNRYTNGIITITRDNTQFLVLRKPLNLELDNTDVLVKVRADQVNRLDNISQLAYGTPGLWWVVAEYNGIRDPLFDLKAGQIIRIPTIERVLTAIGTINT